MDDSISLLIPAWNEEKIISKTLEYLNRLKLPFNYSELILIAGGNDKTFEICKNAKLDNFKKLITIEQIPGDYKSGALIKGINTSNGNIIILMDADVILAPSLIIEVAKNLKKYDVVCCNFIPMMADSFWKNYYYLFKLLWNNNPSNLGSLIGGTTISLRREVIVDIGVQNFFSKFSTAGVDYYMGLVLKKNKKTIGFIKNASVIMPRPNNLIDFIKDQRRWLNAFFSLHKNDKKLILMTLLFNFSFNIAPPLLFLSIIKKSRKITLMNKLSKLKTLYTLFFVDYIINFMSIIYIIKLFTKSLKNLGHFKGQDRYLS